MTRLIVKAKKLNKRKIVPAFLPEATSIIGVVNENFIFTGDEVVNVPNPALGKWYKDQDGHFYWGGALQIVEEEVNEHAPELAQPDNTALENILITPRVKRKIEQVINAFETGKAEGNYATLVKFADHSDPETNTRIVQITYGRSQTTEFSHLRELVQEYVDKNGNFSEILKPFLPRIGKKPSLATNETFCTALKDAGKTDSIMKACQDQLFESKYYQPAHAWFSVNEFTLPLSMLVIYDSRIHSGGILSFLRKRFSTAIPSNGGNEKEWITNYVNVRHSWLKNHSIELLRNTTYRTRCFQEQIENDNWELFKSLKANGVAIQ